MATNVLNAKGLYREEIEGAVVRSLQRWEQASGGAFAWDHWAGHSPKVYVPGVVQDGLSSIHFLSNSVAAPSISIGAAAYTQLW